MGKDTQNRKKDVHNQTHEAAENELKQEEQTYKSSSLMKTGQSEIPKLSHRKQEDDDSEKKQKDKIKKTRNRYSILILKVIGAILGALAVAIGVMLIVANVKHRKLLKEEEKYLTPPGQMVEVNGHDIHVVHTGNVDSKHTLVFIHSNRVVDDSVALEPLFDELSDYELVYIDRSGVGYSQDWDAPKDIDSMLEETRQALKSVTDDKSYILVASQTGGIEAAYWAQKYPEEVEAVVGLQMYLPEQYNNMDDDAYSGITNKLMLGLVKAGAHRMSDSGSASDSYNIYSKDQMTKRNALIAKNLYTRGMYNEDEKLVKNAKKVAEAGWPEDTPVYLIYSNPYKDPYLHENEDLVETYDELASKEEDGHDPADDYNTYYKEFAATHGNVTVEEVSGPDRLIVYNPQKIAEFIQNYINKNN